MPGLAKTALYTSLHNRPQVQEAGANFLLRAPRALIRKHQLIQLQSMLAALGQQLRARRERVRGSCMRTDFPRLGFIAANDEAAANGVVILLTQDTEIFRQRGESHAV